MSIQLIVSDLDGTLFRRDHTISAENLSAIREAQDRGVRFVLCTGRPIQDIYRWIYAYEELKTCGIFGMNGGTFIGDHEGRPLYNVYFTEEQWRGCVEIIQRYPVRSVISGSAFRNGRLWLDYPSEFDMLGRGIGSTEPGFVPPDDGAEWVSGVNKIICFAKDHDPVLVSLRSALLEVFPKLEIRSSWIDNIEICPEGCHKGEAIHKLSEYFGVPVEGIMALGDNENDIPMLSEAGIGVCMSNGTDAAKAVCAAVAQNDDACGVARAIRQFAL